VVLAVLFVFGAVVGSFLNVCSYSQGKPAIGSGQRAGRALPQQERER